MDFKSTFESLKDRATDLAQAGVAQSKRLAEIAKLKTANMAYASLCEKITASKALIETNNERIAELKQSGDPETAEDIVVEAEPAAEEPAEPAAVETAAEEVPAEEDKAE